MEHQWKFFLFLGLIVCHTELSGGAPQQRPPSWFYHRFYMHYQDHISNWWDRNSEIQLLQEYLRIPSVHPDPDYGPCVEFLQRQAKSLNLPLNVYHPSLLEKPVVVITWKGIKPNLPSILLNSHMDVVPVYPESWSYPPFAAEIDKEGRIFARGTQDTKGQGMSYLGAIRQLKSQGFRPKRTVHLLYVPDEEIGGDHGMRAFVETRAFRDLNVGFAIDEGLISSTDTLNVNNGEKTIWNPVFKAKGLPGHGSILFNNTAGEGFSALLGKLNKYRQMQVKKQKSGTPAGNVTSINLTKVSGGVHTNVIPEELTATYDMRLALDEDEDAFLAQLYKWIQESGGNIEVSFERKEHHSPPTILNDSDPFWMTFRKTITGLNFKVDIQIMPGITDMRYMRSKGIRGINFNPINKTPLLMHAHNEFIFASQYLQAIKCFAQIIEKLSGV